MPIVTPIQEPQRIAFFRGDVNSVTVQSGSLSTVIDSAQVYYNASQNTFVAQSGGLYYNDWSNADGWKNSSNQPLLGVLFIDINARKGYRFYEEVSTSTSGATTTVIVRRVSSESLVSNLLSLITANGTCKVTSDLVLMGSVTLERNTTIVFDKGTISGNTASGASPSYLIGNNTAIMAPVTQIFVGSNLKLQGVWNVSESYGEWWGAQGDGSTDDSYALQSALDFPAGSVKILNKIYVVNTPLNITQPLVFQGERQYNDHAGVPRIVGRGNSMSYVIGISSSFVTLKNFTVKYEGHGSSVVGICTTDEYYRLVLEGVAANSCNTGFYLHTFLTTIERCTTTGVSVGFYIHGGTSVTMQNCFVKSFIEHAYYLLGLTYSTLTNCCADSHNISAPDGTTGDNHVRSVYGHTYSIKNCKSLSLLNCASEQVSKGFAVDNCDTILISNCRMDMQRISNCKIEDTSHKYYGCWLYCVNVRRLVVDGAYLLNNLDGTGNDYSSWHDGWYSRSNLVYTWAAGNITDSCIHLKNVFMTGRDNPSTLDGVSQYLRSSLITRNNSNVIVEYDHWKRSGTTANCPKGRSSGDTDFSEYSFDDLVGVGFIYMEEDNDIRTMKVWTGSVWKNVQLL